MSFYSNPWGPTSSTLLIGDTTYNAMGNVSPMASAPAASASSMNFGNLGMEMQIFGAISGAIGSFYAAKQQQANLRFQAEMSQINARMAESQAQSLLDQGQRQIGQITMRAGKVKSAQRAAMAANGIVLGEGSAAEVEATTDLIKEIDALTINANATRAAWASRTQGVNESNRALLSRASADAISPFASGMTSLIGSAGSVAQTWYRDNRRLRYAQE